MHLLVFQTPELPASLTTLSPWMDWLGVERDSVWAQLAGQRHRRFIKTHTPLDGLPFVPEVTYVVVARHPLDAAVSLYHQGENLDRTRIRQLTGQPEPAVAIPRPPLRQWLLDWVDRGSDPEEALDSLPGVLWHLSGAWLRRHEPNVVLVHYDDLAADLEGEMRRLARVLEIEVADGTWPALVRAATFEQMRSRADQVAPDALGVLKNRSRFFRRGSSGAGRDLLTSDELAQYTQRAARLAPADLLEWLHRADKAST